VPRRIGNIGCIDRLPRLSRLAPFEEDDTQPTLDRFERDRQPDRASASNADVEDRPTHRETAVLYRQGSPKVISMI
jgi:hypothetical protein